MTIEAIILDLDGPVLDGKLRHYQCYKEILKIHGFQAMPIEQYWNLKRNRASRLEQLKVTQAEGIYSQFFDAWIDLIEHPKMLELDNIQPGAIERLQKWKNSGVKIILATMRQNTNNLHTQLDQLGISKFLKKVVVCDHKRGGKGKAHAVISACRDLDATKSIWIGDTEADVEGAKELGCPIWLITGGLRSTSYLSSLMPDFISPSIADVDLTQLK